MSFTVEQYVEYREAFLKAFPDSKDFPRMDDGDIDVMVLQKWTIKHGMRLASFYKIIEFCMSHPEYDKDIFFAEMAELINRVRRDKKPDEPFFVAHKATFNP